MAVTVQRNVDDALRARLLELYRDAFEPLRSLTATKQTLAASEFSALLDFDATTIFLSEIGDRVSGFALAVSDLKLIPWINPEYFAERFPEHYATGRLLYIPCFLVDPIHQKGTTFMAITRELARYYGALDSVLAMDCCQYNVDVEQFPSILGAVSERFTPTTTHELDRQTFWAFELGDG